MAETKVKCIYYVIEEVSKMGVTKRGYICQSTECGHSLVLEYSKNGCVAGITESIIDMRINGNDIRDTARVLGMSQGTVIKAIKKEPLLSNVNKRFPQQLQNPGQIAIKLEKVQEAEADEMWSFVRKKSIQRYASAAICVVP